MSLTKSLDSADDYWVRRYDSGDRAGILSLLETGWEERPSTEWFDWKYKEDPYLSHVPITLAERDGEIVAVQGYIPCPIRWRDETVLALKPVDAMVHPDHRRNGLYTRITEKAIAYYRDREPALFFNFPNAASLGAQKKLGWSVVDVMSMYYRLQRPAEMMPTDGPTALLGRPANAVARAYLGVRDRLSAGPRKFDIVRTSSVSSETLESVYDSAVPTELHAYRDTRLYRWFLDAPNYDHTVYVARCDGRPVACLITRSVDGREVYIVDALPMSTAHDAFGDLLATAIADNADASVLSTTGQILPQELLVRFGFVSYDNTLLSRLCMATYLAARPLCREDEQASIPWRTLSNGENWRVSFFEVKD